jgi:MarC family membrane protein
MTLLILIFDPFGNFPIFSSTLKNYSVEKRSWIIVREHIIAFVILFAFMVAGQHFLKMLGLTSTSLQLAGAVILFLIAIKMVFPSSNANEEEILDHEPFIVPLAIPLIAGPSALATVMLLVSQQPEDFWIWVAAMGAGITISMMFLLIGDRVQHILGKRFLIAMERLMGLILVAISVEMLLRGIKMIEL